MIDLTTDHLGEVLALGTAISWAFAVILFKRSGERVHPIALNLYKSILAAVLLVPTIYLFGERILRPAPEWEYGLLLFSGALGIGVADSLFFKSLNLIGAGMSAIVDCLYSPFIIGLSMLWLGERLTAVQAIGVLLIISAVLTATRKKGRGELSRRDLAWGIFYGVLAMAAMAIGIVIIKPLLERSPLLWVTEIRLIGGLMVLSVVLAAHPGRRRIVSSALGREGWGYTFWGSFLGTYVALVLWLGGMKYTLASVSAALNQTSNIFIFLFAAIFLKEPINLLRSIGIVFAIIGVFLVTFG